ncbi:hypothetical protein GWI33_013974 [Rhynchophorus ferrugineus]|uniref:Uncharacterized protein n=1 Tax=Rhynchophorus ferrugineus TaxID=354439 RepID=A0A834I2P3_RHYFE|nr:hypothetical protein GWI33_013974 [Rhynchophorus ferrugineus]
MALPTPLATRATFCSDKYRKNGSPMTSALGRKTGCLAASAADRRGLRVSARDIIYERPPTAPPGLTIVKVAGRYPGPPPQSDIPSTLIKCAAAIREIPHRLTKLLFKSCQFGRLITTVTGRGRPRGTPSTCASRPPHRYPFHFVTYVCISESISKLQLHQALRLLSSTKAQ